MSERGFTLLDDGSSVEVPARIEGRAVKVSPQSVEALG